MKNAEADVERIYTFIGRFASSLRISATQWKAALDAFSQKRG